MVRMGWMRRQKRGRIQTVSETWEQAMNSLVQRFLKDESGASAVEYGLIAAGI